MASEVQSYSMACGRGEASARELVLMADEMLAGAAVQMEMRRMGRGVAKRSVVGRLDMAEGVLRAVMVLSGQAVHMQAGLVPIGDVGVEGFDRAVAALRRLRADVKGS